MTATLFAVLRTFKAGDKAPNHLIDEVEFFETSRGTEGRRVYTEVFNRIYVIRAVKGKHLGKWQTSRTEAQKALPALIAATGIAPPDNAAGPTRLAEIVKTNRTATEANRTQAVEIRLAHAGFTEKYEIGSPKRGVSIATTETPGVTPSALSKGQKR